MRSRQADGLGLAQPAPEANEPGGRPSIEPGADNGNDIREKPPYRDGPRCGVPGQVGRIFGNSILIVMNKLFDFFLNEHGLILTEGQIQDIIHEVARYLAENPKEAGDLAEVMKNEKQ